MTDCHSERSEESLTSSSKKARDPSLTLRMTLRLTDIFIPALLLALAIARWGNYFNQELFGRPTNLPWGIFIDQAHRPELFASSTHFHPTFLYQSIFYFLILIALTIWIKKRPSIKTGLITGISLIALGLGRIMTELLRVDQVPLILGIRLPLLVSVCILASGLILIISIKYKASSIKGLNKIHNT